MSWQLSTTLLLLTCILGGVVGIVILVRRVRVAGERRRFQLEPRVGDLAGCHHSSTRDGHRWLVGEVIDVRPDPHRPWAKLRVYLDTPDGSLPTETWWEVRELRWFPEDTKPGVVED